MTIDEAIKKLLDKAEEQEYVSQIIVELHREESEREHKDACDACAADHRQLAEWLTELKETKRLLKLAVEDIEGRSADKCKGCIYENASDREKYVNCTNFHCYEWRYTDEALKLIGDEDV